MERPGAINSRSGNLRPHRGWQHAPMEGDAGPGHVIVCGLQGVGLRTVEQFHLSGTRVVVIDDDADPRFSRALQDWGVEHIRRHAYRGEGFAEADLDGASAVVCVEVDEIHTLETALRVRELRPR